MKICLYGAAREQIHPSFMEAAGAFGRSLARRGHTLVYGGGAWGMMGAAARGVQSQQGRLIAVAPGDVNADGEIFEANSRLILTRTLAERKEMFMHLSDAFVVMPGGIGTLDEFFDLLSVKRLTDWTAGAGTESQTNIFGSKDDGSADPLLQPSVVHISQKPVAVYNINGYFDPLLQLLEHTIREEFAGAWTRELYRFCSTEAEVWQCLEGFPEECCDAAELTDADYDMWERRSEKGFWRSFLEEQEQ